VVYLPEDVHADGAASEEGHSGSNAVALLNHLVQHKHHQGSTKQLRSITIHMLYRLKRGV
jgi:site-specific recombinase